MKGPNKTFALLITVYLISFQLKSSLCQKEQNVWRQGTGTGNEYLLTMFKTDKTFHEMNAYCKSLGGTLPMIKNQFEQNAVSSLGATWLAAKRFDKKFYWLDGSKINPAMPYIRFYRGVIDYTHDGIFMWSNGNWDTKRYNYKLFHVVCERAISGNPLIQTTRRPVTDKPLIDLSDQKLNELRSLMEANFATFNSKLTVLASNNDKLINNLKREFEAKLQEQEKRLNAKELDIRLLENQLDELQRDVQRILHKIEL